MKQMATYSERIGISMKDAFSLADKASTLEGAVEMATRLQTMGGKFGQMDAMELTHMAQYDPEKLQKMMTENLAGTANVYRDKDGSLQIAQESKRMMKEIADITGMGYKEMSESVMKQHRLGDVEKILGRMDLNSEQMGQIAGLVSTKDGGRYELDNKDLGSMSKSDIVGYLDGRANSVAKNGDPNQRAMKSQGLQESIDRYTKQLHTSTVGLIENLEDWMSKYNTGVSNMYDKSVDNLISEGYSRRKAEGMAGGASGAAGQAGGNFLNSQLTQVLLADEAVKLAGKTELGEAAKRVWENPSLEKFTQEALNWMLPEKQAQPEPLIEEPETNNAELIKELSSLSEQLQKGIRIHSEDGKLMVNLDITNMIDSDKLTDKISRKLDAKWQADRIGTIG